MSTELLNKAADEIRKMDAKGLRELETDVRREIALIRMDINGVTKQKGRVRGLKSTLARVLTVRNEAMSGKTGRAGTK